MSNLPGHATRTRHVLDVWALFALWWLGPAISGWAGSLYSVAISLVGVAAAIRIAFYGKILQSLAFCIAFPMLSLGMLPFITAFRSAFEQYSKPQSSVHEPSPDPSYGWPSPPDRATERAHPEVPPAPRPPPLKAKIAGPPVLPPPRKPPGPLRSSAAEPAEQARELAELLLAACRRGEYDLAATAALDRVQLAKGASVEREFYAEVLADTFNAHDLKPRRRIPPPEVRKVEGGWEVALYTRLSGEAGTRMQQRAVLSLAPDRGSLGIRAHSSACVPSIARDVPPRVFAAWAAVCDSLEAELGDELDAAMAAYAPQVDYFGAPMTRAEIREDKRRYSARWPYRTERFQGEFSAKETPAGLVECSFRSLFRVEAASGEWCEGEVEHSFAVETGGQRARIVRQSARILSSRQGKN